MEAPLSFVAIVLSLLAAAFTGLQWYEARQTRMEIHADTERSLQLSQRAYVSVGAATLPRRIFSKRKMQLELLVIGPTPALDVHMSGRCSFVNAPDLPKEPDSLWKTPLDEYLLPPVLGPGTKITLHCEAIMDPEHPASFLFAVGIVSYRDIFKFRHQTKFCFVDYYEISEGGNMSACSDNNDVD